MLRGLPPRRSRPTRQHHSGRATTPGSVSSTLPFLPSMRSALRIDREPRRWEHGFPSDVFVVEFERRKLEARALAAPGTPGLEDRRARPGRLPDGTNLSRLAHAARP